jgi:hypothetical protein
MSRTYHESKSGEKLPAKTLKKRKDKKHFGFTSGTHSQFEEMKEYWRQRAQDPSDNLAQKRWEELKDKTYPEKGEDYVKYGYGNGMKKETKKKKK